MPKLSDIRVGDTALIRVEKISNSYFNIVGSIFNNYMIPDDDNRIEVTDVVSKPIEPAVGQTWGRGIWTAKLLYVDGVGALVQFEDGRRAWWDTKSLKASCDFIS